MQKLKMPLPVDFSASAFSKACSMLACPPQQAEIIIPPLYIVEASRLAAEWKCQVLLVPHEIMKTQVAWAVRYKQAVVWSEGVE